MPIPSTSLYPALSGVYPGTTDESVPGAPPTFPSYSVIIAGVERVAVTVQTFSVQEELGRQSSTMQLTIEDAFGDMGTAPVIPKPLDTITIVDTNIAQTIFGGVISRPRFKWLGPGTNQWVLQCRDFSYYPDTTTVNGTFIGKTADAIIKTLVAQANIGLTTNHVVPGPVIPSVQISYMSLTDAIKRISQLASGAVITGSGYLGPAIALSGRKAAEFVHYVDEAQDLHWFNALTADVSPVVITDSPALGGIGSTIVAHYNRDTFSYDWDAQNIRTAAIVRGGRFNGVKVDKFVSNGQTTAWPLTYDFDKTIASASLTVGGVQKTLTFDTTQTPNHVVTTEYVIVQSTNGQWFLINGTEGVTPAGLDIILTYTYGGTIVARVDDHAQQAFFGGSNRGTFEVVINDRSLQSFATAYQRAQREIIQYSDVYERVTLTTTEEFVGHFRSGQVLMVTLSTVPDSQNGYSVGFTAPFLCERLTINGLPGGYRTYNIQAARIG